MALFAIDSPTKNLLPNISLASLSKGFEVSRGK
jgi:hypothetical protein